MQLMKTCAALAEVGHQISLWLPGRRPGLDWGRLARHYGIRTAFPVRWLRSLTALRGYEFCVRAVLAGRFWGAELFYVWPYQAGAWASWWGLPTLMELHDRPAGRMGPRLFRAFLRGRGARRVLVTTEALRSGLEQAYGRRLEAPFALVTPNGVDLERYRALPEPAEARAALGLPQEFTAGYTGHLYEGRGLALMAELARRMPEVLFLWAGGEPETVDRWTIRLRRDGVENVHLLGFIPNERLPLVQAACETLLMPYQRRIAVSSGGDTAATASPMKVFEYLAAGRAILASDLPVIREVLNPSNAVLLPPEDLDAWESALRRMKKYPQRRARLGDQGRREARRHSWTERAHRALEGLG